VDSISLLGRNTQGVTVMKVSENDRVASIAAIAPEERKARQARDQETITDNGASPNGSVRGRSLKAAGPADDEDDDELDEAEDDGSGGDDSDEDGEE
jgi:DNA gyrase subunit A